MQGDSKKITDSQNSLRDTSSMSVSAQSFGISPVHYNKANKLITALYMVTDIIEETEPLRNKLRTLGTEIISDIYSISVSPDINRSMLLISRISETISFLDLASTINIISQMNGNILKKEFLVLKEYIEGLIGNSHPISRQIDLSLFFQEELPSPQRSTKNNRIKSIGHTRIGVQRGGTLMKALSDKTSILSDIKSSYSNIDLNASKRERREEIINIIKTSTEDSSGLVGYTITDIRNKATGPLSSIGEKTLQRELIAMVKDNVLYRTGSKRWSRYSISKSN